MNWRRNLTLLGMVLGGLLVAGAGLETESLSPMLRTQVEHFDPVVVVETTTTATTTGQRGVVFVSQLCASASACTSAPTSTTADLGALPYPARLDVRLVDLYKALGANASTALTCTSATIWGTDVFGMDRREVLTSITESEKLTAYAYESVTRVAVAGCNASDEDFQNGSATTGRSTDDYVVVRASDHVGLRQKIGANTNVLSVCRVGFTASARAPKCARGTVYTVNTKANSIDLAQAGGGTLLTANGNKVWVTIRGSRY